MKLSTSWIAIASLTTSVAADFFPPNNGSLPHNARDLSARGRDVLARQTYDYCDTTYYYYCIASTCCGTTTYSCMDPGGECCASLSTYGYGLWCPSGSSCAVVSGYVQCQNTDGSYYSADSSAVETDTATEPPSTATRTPSSHSYTKKSKSKAWIAGAVIGPLIGVAVVAGVVFFLCMMRKKKNANAGAATPFNQGGPPANQPVMNPQQLPMAPAPQMGAAPAQQNSDLKTPAYTQAYAVPSPVASPPPQWTPAAPVSPMMAAASPAPYNQPQQPSSGPHGPSPMEYVSPMNTGNGMPYSTPVQQQQQQPGYGNAMGSPMGQAQVQAPRNDARELHG